MIQIALPLHAKLFWTSNRLRPQAYVRQYSIFGDPVCGGSSLLE
jgi:hypothetical protein